MVINNEVSSSCGNFFFFKDASLHLLSYRQGQFQKNNMGSSFVDVIATPQSPSHVVSHVKWRGD